jgi:hypothetical protein
VFGWELSVKTGKPDGQHELSWAGQPVALAKAETGADRISVSAAGSDLDDVEENVHPPPQGESDRKASCGRYKVRLFGIGHKNKLAQVEVTKRGVEPRRYADQWGPSSDLEVVVFDHFPFLHFFSSILRSAMRASSSAGDDQGGGLLRAAARP